METTSATSLNSPEFEFEFWNPNSPFLLHSADQLFSHGFLLPLHSLLPPPPSPPPPPSHVVPSPLITSSNHPVLTASKRWTHFFTKTPTNPNPNDNNNNNDNDNSNKVVSKRKGISRRNNKNTAELNINIWPFSRSRSSGSNRSIKPPSSNRKVSSAPCSRSNSSSRKSTSSCPTSSPGRGGVHLGRASPVWQVKRKVVNRQQASCRSRESRVVDKTGISNNLFGFRGLFSKKTTNNNNAMLF